MNVLDSVMEEHNGREYNPTRIVSVKGVVIAMTIIMVGMRDTRTRGN